MAQADLVPVRGTEKRLPAQAEPAGSLEPDEQVDVTVMLRPRSERELARETAGPRAVPERLSRQAFAERFGADQADVARVEAFAARHGLRVLDLSRDGWQTEQREVANQGTAYQRPQHDGPIREWLLPCKDRPNDQYRPLYAPVPTLAQHFS